MSDNKNDDPTAAPEIREEILRLRGSIDNIDAAVLHLLAERFKFTRRVGVLKAKAGVEAKDPVRDAQQIARLTSIAEEAGLDPEFALQFQKFIVSEVIRQHKLIAANQGDLPLDTYN